MARDERELAEEHREQRRLARAVAAGDGDPVARGEVEVDGAEPERPALARPRPAARRGWSPPRSPARSVSRSSHGSNGFSTSSTRSSARSACRTFVISACVPRRSAPPVCLPIESPCARASLVRFCSSASTCRRRSCASAKRAYCRCRSSARRSAYSLQPPAHSRIPCVHGSTSTIRVTTRSRSARSCETTTRPPVAPQQEALEAVEPVEVEVVRRLVEQQHVEAREEDRSEREPGRLPAGELRRRPVEVDVEAELGADGACARVEVAAAERQEPVERERVRLAGGGIRREGGGEVGERPLRLRDPGAAREVAADRLVRPYVRLLRQVADRQRRRRARHRPRVGGLEPRCEPEQRRLAHAVRADEAEALLGADRQRDVGEDGAGAVVSGDAGELDSHAGTS